MTSKPGEQLMAELGALLRSEEDDLEQRALWPLCAGELSDVEREELERRALTDPELARSLDAYRPLGADSTQQLEALFLARARSQPRKLWQYGGFAAACAAAVGIWLVRPAPHALEIPAYALTAHSAQTQRAPASEVTDPSALAVAADTPVELFLRPAHGVAYAVTARACLYDGSTCSEWPARTEVSKAGSVHLALAALHEPIPHGAELWVAVGVPERLDENMTQLMRARAPSPRGFQAWRIQLKNLQPSAP